MPTNNARPRPPGPEAARLMLRDRNKRFRRRLLLALVLAVAMLVVWRGLQPLLPGPPPPVVVPYSTMKEQVAAGNVTEITVSGETIRGEFHEPVAWPAGGHASRDFQTRAPGFLDMELMPLLQRSGVVVNAKPPEQGVWWVGVFLNLLPALILFGLLFWMMDRLVPGRGLLGIGKGRGKKYVDESEVVTFADVAGIDEAREELVEVVDFLKNPERYLRVGGTIPKGVLLVGPPGTGKTLLARAVAGEAGVPFYSMSASEFVEMVAGVGASRVRDLFRQAKKNAPAIIFIDELDAVGRARGGSASAMSPAHGEREQTLNQLLVEMDGFDARLGVIVLGATNRPDVLDQALLRPGRFDRRVTIPRPDRPGREKILEVHTRGVPIGPDVSLKDLASATSGLVGAELRNLVNEAALRAARKGREVVVRDDFAEAMEKIMLGTARSIALSDEDRRRIAYHEAGHALVALNLPDADRVHKVTIVPRGQALGVTYQMPVDDRHNYTREYLLGRITGALGGRAAEELVFGEITTGAENDLKLVTEIARRMVTQWGMSDEVGLLSTDGLADEGDFRFRPLSEESTRAIRGIVDDCYARALGMLRQERHKLDALAGALLERDSLDEEEINLVLMEAGASAPYTGRPSTPRP